MSISFSSAVTPSAFIGGNLDNTASITVPGGARKLLVWAVLDTDSGDGSGGMATATFNGVAMSLFATVPLTTGGQASRLYVVNDPTVGTFNITIKHATKSCSFVAFTISATNQITLSANAGTSATTTTPTSTISSATGNTVLHFLSANNLSATGVTETAGQTIIGEYGNASSSYFGVTSLSGTETSTATWSIASNRTSTLAVNIVEESASIISINDGSAVTPGKNDIRVLTAGFSAKPTAVTAAYTGGTLTATIGAGTKDDFMIALQDRVDGQDWPLVDAVITYTFSYATESASLTQLLTTKVGETRLLLAGVITDDPASIGYELNIDNINPEGAEIVYSQPPATGTMPVPDLLLTADGGGTVTEACTFPLWIRPVADKSGFPGKAGNVYYYEWTIQDSVTINRYGVASTLTTVAYPTATSITVDGKNVTGFSGSANSYNYTIPALSAGATVPRCGIRTLTITDGTTPTNYDVNVLPSTSQDYVTLTNNGGTGVGFIGNYIACVAGDQIVFSTPASLSVPVNRVTQTGAVQSDYSGNQTWWHIRASDGLVTELTIITPAVGIDIIPNQFTFVDQTQVAVSTVIESAPITITGVTAATDVAISITGGEYSVSTDGGTSWGAFTSASTTVQLGYLVKVRVTTSSSFNTPISAVLTVGNITDTFSATTRVADTDPNPFTFIDQTNVEASATITSNAITVLGIDTGITASIIISGGEYSINGGAYTATAGVVSLNDIITVQLTSSNLYSTQISATLTIGTIADTFTATTRAVDSVPTQFTFVDQNNVEPSTTIISNDIIVVGIDIADTPQISITGGEYSINGGAYTAVAGVVELDDVVTVRVTSNSSFTTGASATLTIGTIFDTFTATTRAAITTPTQFSFVDQNNASISTQVTSNSITVLGVDPGVPISISIANGQYSINGGTYTSGAGVVYLNDTVTVRLLSSAIYEDITASTLSIGGVTDSFVITTESADVNYNPISFTFATNQPRNTTIVSDTRSITGISVGIQLAVTIEGGTYSINGGAFTNVAGTVSNNDTIAVSLVTAPSYNSSSSLTVSIGAMDYTVTAYTAQGRGVLSINNGDPIVSGQMTTISIYGMSTIDVVAVIFNVNGVDMPTTPFNIIDESTLSIQVPPIVSTDTVSVRVTEYTVLRTVQTGMEQIVSQLQVFTPSTNGFVPAPNTVNQYFLRDDGTWDLPDALPVFYTIIGIPAPTSIISNWYDPASGSVGYLRFTFVGDKTATVQNNLYHATPVGAAYHIRNVGSGLLTLDGQAGVIINPPAGGTLIVEMGGSVTLICVGDDEYDLIGQVVAA